jgi:hypothetical protein
VAVNERLVPENIFWLSRDHNTIVESRMNWCELATTDGQTAFRDLEAIKWLERSVLKGGEFALFLFPTTVMGSETCP